MTILLVVVEDRSLHGCYYALISRSLISTTMVSHHLEQHDAAFVHLVHKHAKLLHRDLLLVTSL